MLQLSREHEGAESKVATLQREQNQLRSEVKNLKELENEREKLREVERRGESQRLREAERERDQAKAKLVSGGRQERLGWGTRSEIQD